jgi:hypothetical protein
MKKAMTVAALAIGRILAADDHDHKHEHTAPHGGTLVVFGEEAAHVELVLDAKEGKLTAYVLDGEAENAVRIKQADIAIAVTWPATKNEKGEEVRKTSILKLAAVEHELTGEKVGDTSEFAVQSDELKDAKEFDAVIPLIEIKGMKFEKTAFNFPKGNEESEGEHEHEEEGSGK